MRVGKMRYRIEIQSYLTVQDGEGFETKQWETIYTVWADITPVSASEYFASNREEISVTNKIYIRYLPGITSKMRIKYGDRMFNLESVLAEQRKGYLTLMAVEVT